MERLDESGGWQGSTQKLRDAQVAHASTWTRVPDTDTAKAASHVIRVLPVGSTTVAHMFELDPGISGETAGEGRGWLEAPRAPGSVAVHGRVLR